MKQFKVFLFCAALVVFFATPVSLRADLGDGGQSLICYSSFSKSSLDALLLVKECYVDKIDPAVLDTAYKSGGLAEVFKLLDPHSRYLDEEAAAKEDQSEQEAGSFGGVGLQLFLTDKNITVIGVIADSPASREDIKENDIITAVCQSKNECLEIDSKKLDLKDDKEKVVFLSDIVSKIRGKIDTNVMLKIKRQGIEGDIVITLKRAVIRIENVTSKIYGDFGYVRLMHFSNNAAQQLTDAISKFSNLKGLILDLRGNPGGYLPQANAVSALFLNRKDLIETIVTRLRPQSNPERYFAANYQSLFRGNFKMPLVVLVDQGSASASEIVAGTIQDHQRGVIVGIPTFGKALVQTRFDFGKERAYITTGRIYRPSGKSLQGKGVIPDFIVSNAGSELLEKQMKEYRDKFSEKGLTKYLKGEEEELTAEEKAKFSLMLRDKQLETGLEILKVMSMK